MQHPRDYDGSMQQSLRTRCVCGWETTGPEDDVVAATLDHGLRVHNMGGTREDVLQRAERVEEGPADAPATAATMDELRVVDVPEHRRFEARLGSQTIGFTRYAERDGRIALLHTEIDPSVEGQGYGSKLASGVLDAVTSRGLEVVVHCPFIGAYVRRHTADYPTIDLSHVAVPSGGS